MGKTFETVNRGVMIALLLLGLLALTANGQCNINNLCAYSGLDRCVPSGATCASTFSGGFSTITLTVPAGQTLGWTGFNVVYPLNVRMVIMLGSGADVDFTGATLSFALPESTTVSGDFRLLNVTGSPTTINNVVEMGSANVVLRGGPGLPAHHDLFRVCRSHCAGGQHARQLAGSLCALGHHHAGLQVCHAGPDLRHQHHCRVGQPGCRSDALLPDGGGRWGPQRWGHCWNCHWQSRWRRFAGGVGHLSHPQARL